MRTIARIHWLGMNHFSGETNATQLLAVLKLPQTQRLERQTLDKLSLAPWPLLHRSPDTNAAALLQPLLNDAVSNESCLQIQCATNQPGELVFAIRLDDQRAALWQTNLARVLESLTGIQPVPAADNRSGWSLQKHHVPNLIELVRVGGWTLIGAAEATNSLLDELATRIEHGQAPLATENTNAWLVADLDLPQVSSALALGWNLPQDTPEISLTVTRDGAALLAQGSADFPEPLAPDLKPWIVPTNLIDEKLSSFTLVRGFQAELASSEVWTNLQIGPPPDQACFWGVWGIPTQSYFTAPLPDASNAVERLTDLVLQDQRRWFGTNGLARFERSTKFNRLDWKGLPYMSPFLRSITVSNDNFVYGGGFPAPQIQPLSLGSVQAALSRTNLVYHDWEMTGQRIDQWIFMGQFARLAFHKAQLPPGSAGLLWLQAIAPKLGVSVTDITQTGPNQLSFTRKSDLGFTGIELNLLADWLESPQFPLGLHTFAAPPPTGP